MLFRSPCPQGWLLPRGFNTNGRDGVDFIVLELEPGAVDAKKSFLRDLEEFVVREIFVMFRT